MYTNIEKTKIQTKTNKKGRKIMVWARRKSVPDYGRPKRREIGFMKYFRNFINKFKNK